MLIIIQFLWVSDNFHEFRALGSRGHNGQSSVSFLDPDTGVLFYALAVLNAIACWKPQNTFTIEQQGFIYVDNVTMVFPNDLKVITFQIENGILYICIHICMYVQLTLSYTRVGNVNFTKT